MAGNKASIGNYKCGDLDLSTVDKLMDLSSGNFSVSGKLTGDVNNDDDVSILDLALSARNYNVKNTSSNWDGSFDINGDGIVDIYDLTLISRNMRDQITDNWGNIQ